jgi:hypothetical protein
MGTKIEYDAIIADGDKVRKVMAKGMTLEQAESCIAGLLDMHARNVAKPMPTKSSRYAIRRRTTTEEIL